MKITEALFAEHLVFYHMFDHIEAVAPQLRALGEVKTLAALLESLLKNHSDTEDELFIGPLSTASSRSASGMFSCRNTRNWMGLCNGFKQPRGSIRRVNCCSKPSLTRASTSIKRSGSSFRLQRMR